VTFTPLVSAEPFVRSWLAAQFPTARVVTETPANLADVLPVIEVTRFGGSDEVIVLDSANIDVDVYAATRDAARTLGEQVRTALRLHLPGYASAGAAVQSVTTISAPRWVPYDNTSLRRFNAAYRITIHSIPS
jgi:hypothetical protein